VIIYDETYILCIYFFWIKLFFSNYYFNGKNIKCYYLKQTVNETISISVSSRILDDLRLRWIINKFHRYYITDVFCENPSKSKSTNRIVGEVLPAWDNGIFSERGQMLLNPVDLSWTWRWFTYHIVIIILMFTFAMNCYLDHRLRSFFHGKCDDVKSTFSTNYLLELEFMLVWKTLSNIYLSNHQLTM